LSLRNRVALVAGASRGIGKEIALTLGRAGVRVAVSYRTNKLGAQKVVDELRSASRSVALEEVRHGITVNVVNPPVIDDKALSLQEAEKLVDARFPVGRPATARDVAEAVKFFASDEAAFITGQVINVSGGWML